MIVGVLGGGQLARMLALAGHPLGVSIVALDPAADACVAPVARHLRAGWEDRAALDELARSCDVVTFEFENVPSGAAEFLAARVPVRPGVDALRVSADRAAEKALFRRLGMGTAPFAAPSAAADLAAAAREVGFPAILKTRHSGYDGKGQTVVRNLDELAAAWGLLAGAPAILEGFVAFERELSVIAARRANGEIAFWPVSENTHRAGILRVAISRPGDPRQAAAEQQARALLESLDYVGVLALELFDVGGELLANEFAPRVHNSGHWTPHGAETSQFENHLRAVLDLPLGATSALGHVAMVNFIGGVPAREKLLAIPNLHLELYGKAPKRGRKIGHATVRAADPAACARLTAELAALAAAAADG